MEKEDELFQLAKKLPIEDRKKILISYKETDLHVHLKQLLGRMDRNSLIEITHGSDEHGNDLVMLRKDVFLESVIGIIVKAGNIKGKTKGTVDEIKSQVEQSLIHPVRLKAIPDRTLLVSEVWVIISGDLSKAAHERLEKEVITKGRNIRIDFGIDWLVKSFSEFYPQVFFEGKVMDFLAEKIIKLETSEPLFSIRGKNLSECFVEPMISEFEVPGKLNDKTFNLVVEKHRMPFQKWSNIFKPNGKAILFGEPGVGKSIVLKKYMLDKLQEAWSCAINKELQKQLEIPIKISASEFLAINSCEDLILQYIQPHTEIFDRIKVIGLIIDGLDEVFSTQRNELLEKAKIFSNQLNCSLLLSTRKTDLVKNPPEGFEKCEILPFSYSQALELYEKLTFDERVLNALREGLEGIRNQVPMTPLSLFLLLKIVEANKEIPASIWSAPLKVDN